MATTSKSTPPEDDGDELRTIVAEQRRQLMAAGALESDLDLAFRLQLQEAITASLSVQPSSSSSPPPPPPQLPASHSHPSNDDLLHNVAGALQTLELEKFEQELDDRALLEAEMKKMREDLGRRIHDHRVALEIQRMSEEEWEDQGDNFERPYGEGSSKNANTEVFRVYFKGMVSEERVGVGDSSGKVSLAGIGVAICDSRDEMIFELRKPLAGKEMSRRVVEVKALIEGLNAAIALDLKRVVFYCDYYPIYNFVTGKWVAKQQKILTLVNQVALLQSKFTLCRPSLVARNDIKFAFKLAREAIVSQISKPAESTGAKNESCAICLEDTDVGHIFSVDGCMHRYCFSCMRQHVEVKLLQGMVAKCPHEGCNSELKTDSCGKFLTPKLIELMSQRVKEASIPHTEKIYCPYPKCSALMSKSEVLECSKLELAGPERLGIRKCIKCRDYFCINCKVPWHYDLNCSEYKRKNPNRLAEDAKLKTLAERNLWRQCVKCNHMIELAAGCYHMTCRCGYEFCYTCGAEWKNKKATCSCPLWDEENILYDDEDEDEFDEDESEEDYYDSDSDDYY